MKIRKYEHEDEAGEEILAAVDGVLDIYRTIGGIINEIDRKNAVYTKSSVEKIKYLMTADQSIKGKLVDMLTAYAKAPEKDTGRIVAIFEQHININRQEFFDGRSLYHKNVLARRGNA
jgi:hypothetical protein